MGFGNSAARRRRCCLSLGFAVNGWSRTDRPMAGVDLFHGEAGLMPFLNATDILVVLLPLTPTRKGSSITAC